MQHQFTFILVDLKLLQRKHNMQRPIRVVHLTHGLEIGGLEKLLVEFARHTDRSKFELKFVSFSGRGALADDIEAAGWPVITLNQPEGLRPGVVLRIAALLRTWQADILHTHDPKTLIYGAPAARLARVHAVHTCHGNALAPFPRATRAFRMAFWFADAMVCVSGDMTRQMVETGIDPRKIHTILNGIDTSFFSFARPNPGTNAVTVARLSPEKDIGTLIRAVAIIRETCPSFQLEIAGDGVCMAELQTMVRELGLEDQVRFLGQVCDVRAVLERSSLFILPSLREGVSLTLLEAMACGLPVVATRVGGTPEVVVDGETGLLVLSGSHEELARAVLSLLQDPDGSRRMGEAARRRIEQYFDISRMIAKYEDIYMAYFEL